MIYFDHNATSPMLPVARDAWMQASEQFIGNPASQHRLGQRADAALEHARSRIAGVLGCDPLEILWTSGATESSNTLLHSLAVDDSRELWISAIEHPALFAPAERYFSTRRRFIPVESSGVISLDWIAVHLKQNVPAGIAVMAANNETGIVQPWRELLDLCHSYEVPLICDATQWLGKLPANNLGRCDFLFGSAHKFGGPRGVGFLKYPLNYKLHPLIVGGSHQNGHRAGTENLPGVLAMVAALETREQMMQEARQDLAQVRDSFENRLVSAIPELQIVGNAQRRLWNTSLLILPDTHCAFRWVVKLDKEGFAVSSGSACASGNEQPSHVLSTMGLPTAAISNAVRVSSGWETPENEWEHLAERIIHLTGQILK